MEFVWTHVIPAPGASEVGLGASALAPLCQDLADNPPRPLFLRRLRTWEPISRNWTPNFVENRLYRPRQTKATSMAAQSAPRWSKGCPREPKGGPKTSQGEQNELQGHPKETNKPQTYIHINEIYADSRSTAIQRPASSYLTSNIRYYIILVLVGRCMAVDREFACILFMCI